MDYKKIDFFIIKEKKDKINYKLNLLRKMKIYSVFYVLLLKSADLRILLVIKKSSQLVQNKKYKIKKIVRYDYRTQQYIIK